MKFNIEDLNKSDWSQKDGDKFYHYLSGELAKQTYGRGIMQFVHLAKLVNKYKTKLSLDHLNDITKTLFDLKKTVFRDIDFSDPETRKSYGMDEVNENYNMLKSLINESKLSEVAGGMYRGLSRKRSGMIKRRFSSLNGELEEVTDLLKQILDKHKNQQPIDDIIPQIEDILSGTDDINQYRLELDEETKGILKLKKDTPEQDIKKYTDKGFDVELNEVTANDEEIEAVLYDTLQEILVRLKDDGDQGDFSISEGIKMIIKDLEKANYDIVPVKLNEVEDINSPLLMKLRSPKPTKPQGNPNQSKGNPNQSKIDKINNNIEKLEKAREEISLEMESDPEAMANATDGNHPSVTHYGDLLTKIDDKIFDLIRKRKALTVNEEVDGVTTNLNFSNYTDKQTIKNYLVSNNITHEFGNMCVEVPSTDAYAITKDLNKKGISIKPAFIKETTDKEKFDVVSKNLIQTNKDLQQLAKAYQAADGGVKKDLEIKIRRKHKIKKELEAYKNQLNAD